MRRIPNFAPHIKRFGVLASRTATQPVVLLVLASVIGVAMMAHQTALVGDFRVDDAYITMSFSKNLASGNGPIFSHGVRVEGYSNFLWMILLSLGMLVYPGDPYAIARFLGLIAMTLIAIFVYRSVARSSGLWAGLLATGFVLSCTDLFRGALSGLETAAFAAALTYGWYSYLAEPWPRWRAMSLAFLPAALIRIDGFIPVLVVLGFEFFDSLLRRRWTPGRYMRWAAPVVLLWGLYFAWRWHYYGLPLPTTYYAKSLARAHDPDRARLMLKWFFDDYRAVALVPFIAAGLIWKPRRQTVALVLAIAVQLIYATHVGADWMPFHRFFVPIVPLVAIVSGWGCERIWNVVRGQHVIVRWPIRLGALACMAFVALRMYAGSIDSEGERIKLDAAVQLAKHTRKNLLRNVDLIRHMLRRPGERLATDYAGVFSVMTDAEIVDMWGLCNADIALHGGAEGINPEYGKSCPECFERLQPDYFHVVVPLVRGKITFSSQSAVIGQIFQGEGIDRVIDLHRNYIAGRVVEKPSGRTLWFLERRRDGTPLVRRDVNPRVYIDYPFIDHPDERL
ncbi:MAG TPA: hypothetical protein VKP30_12495 [Polyangiaceae bacterium]|nr:hypothetical protein [Polyangiaceae bacterium]